MVSDICRKLSVCLVLVPIYSNASQSSLDARIEARTEYNDNIFLTDLPHDSVKGLIISPSLSGVVGEENWEAKLRAKIKSHNYSDDNLDTNDQYFDLSGKYLAQRNILSLNVNYDLASNLNSTSSDFGIVGRRVNTKKQSVAPQYTRLLTERLALQLYYSYLDVDFLEAENTGYTPYVSETGSSTLIYDLTEIDKLTFSLQAVDYNSKNDLIVYQLFTSRLGIDHKFSERLSVDFLVGVSRLKSTNLTTETFDFLGNAIVVTQEVDFINRSSVYDAGIRQLLENGIIEGRISRNITNNSFGGVDRVDRFKLNYSKAVSSLWRYAINARIDDITSKSSGTGDLSRNVFFFESIAYYSVSANWNVNASYRYALRKFSSDTSDKKAPYSNRIYIGITYNFPSLSTF